MINEQEILDGSAGEAAPNGLASANDADWFSRREASIYLKARWGLSCVVYTLARHAANGTGPEYQRVGPRAVYSREALDSWAKTKLTAPGRKAADLRPLTECGRAEL